MPKTLKGKKLTPAEDRQWKAVYESARGSARKPGAMATAAILKRRAKRKGRKGNLNRGASAAWTSIQKRLSKKR